MIEDLFISLQKFTTQTSYEQNTYRLAIYVQA